MSKDIIIPYKSIDFPPNRSIPNTPGKLTTNWNEIVHAAITVGRSNWPLEHPLSSGFSPHSSSEWELAFRLSMWRMAVEQNEESGYLQKTDAFRNLDPTEKGMIDYWLGMTLNNLFASRLLDAFLLHVDVFGNDWGLRCSHGRSRPDLFGYSQILNGWIVMESKGRARPPDKITKQKAKAQVRRITCIDGQRPVMGIAGIGFFESDNCLNFQWADPPPFNEGDDDFSPIELPAIGSLWQEHYRLAIGLSDALKFNTMDIPAGTKLDSGISVDVLPQIREWYGSSGAEELLIPQLIERNQTVLARNPAPDEGWFSDGIRIQGAEKLFEKMDEE